jgi:serine/threonine protein kinase
MLKSLDHENIIKPIDYFIENGNQYIVYEYYDWDLNKIIENELNENQIKKFMKQIIEGVGYLHSKGIIHRDLKPDNILVNPDSNIKINDFDLARFISYTKPMSRGVTTIYYRPPEIFFGDVNYTFAVDMWGLGCILAEMILREPLFKGKNEIEVVCKIFEILGPADEENWPGCCELPNYMPFGSCNNELSLRDVIIIYLVFKEGHPFL